MAAHPLPRPNFTHLADVVQRPRFLTHWERVRHRQAHWFVECMAEFVSSYYACYAFFDGQATNPPNSDWSIPLCLRWYALSTKSLCLNLISSLGVGSTAPFVCGNILGESLSCELFSRLRLCREWFLTYAKQSDSTDWYGI